MTTQNIKDYLKFKATQFFRLRGVEIPTEAEAQKKLLATIPQETRKLWAMEMIHLGA